MGDRELGMVMMFAWVMKFSGSICAVYDRGDAGKRRCIFCIAGYTSSIAWRSRHEYGKGVHCSLRRRAENIDKS